MYAYSRWPQTAFTGVLLGGWNRSGNEHTEVFRVYRSRTGKFVVHNERSEARVNTVPNAARWNTGWRTWVGDWSANQTWTVAPAESRLLVAETLDELCEMLPTELYAIVADITEHPTIADRDI